MDCCLKKKKESVVILVYVKAGAGKNEIIGSFDGRLKVKIAAPPVEGKANKGLLVFLSKVLHIPVSDVLIIAGKRGKRKSVEIRGLKEEEIKRYLEGKGAKNIDHH